MVTAVKLSGKRRKPYAAKITTSWSPDGKQIKKYLGCFKTRQDAYKALSDFNDNPFDLETKKLPSLRLFESRQKVKYKDSAFPAEYAHKKLSPLYNMPFADIRKRHIQMLIDDLKVGHSSKNHIKSLCTMLFSYAIDLEIVSTNYASLVELPPKKQSEIHQPFTDQGLKTLWQNANDFTARLALILCYTGMRPTELLQIKTADIDLRQKFMRGGIKTVAGKNCVIPIADKILPFIAELYDKKK